jgi:hypothetical protein
MQSRSTRIAYVRRMVKRLEKEELRVQELVSSRELSPEEGELAARLVRKAMGEALSELQRFETENTADPRWTHSQ